MPRSGSWLHTFKVSKSTESMTAPELPEAVRAAPTLPSKNEVRRELLGAVSSVLFPGTKVKARRTFGGPSFFGL